MKSCVGKLIFGLWTGLVLLPACVQAAAEAVVVDPNRQLLHAADNGSVEGVMVALRMKADIDVRNNKGYTPLMLAAKRGYEYVVAMLIDKNANVNAESDTKETPLWLAIENHRVWRGCGRDGYVNVVELLIDAGADMNNAREYREKGQRIVRMDALLQAATLGDSPNIMIRMLLEKKADVNKQNELGCYETALMVAVKRGMWPAVQELIYAGADEQCRDSARRTVDDYRLSLSGASTSSWMKKLMIESKRDAPQIVRERGVRSKQPVASVPEQHMMMPINGDDYAPRKEDAAKASVLLKTVVLAGGEAPPSYGEAMVESFSAVDLAMRSAYQLAAQEVRAQGARGGVAQRVVRIQCPACTYDNQEHAHTCDMCGTQLQA